MNSKDVISVLKVDGWIQVAQKGSHVQFKHPVKSGRVRVPHPKERYPDRDVQKHRKASEPQTEVAKSQLRANAARLRAAENE